MNENRAAEACELGRDTVCVPAFVWCEDGHGSPQASGKQRLIVQGRVAVGVEHYEVVDLRQGLEDAG